MVGPAQVAHAQDIIIEPRDGGGNGLLPNTMRAFQIGYYYFVMGENDRAEAL